VAKSMNKLPAIMEALNPPVLYGSEDAKITLLTWGSSWGAVNEAMQTLKDAGLSINQLHFCDIYPLRTEKLRKVLSKSKQIISIEQNVTSQFAQLVKLATGISVHHHINKYDGRPMTARWIVEEIKEAGIK
jgi:2-oxoglutarate ferredoxin oxidoreductase subunit alpha